MNICNKITYALFALTLLVSFTPAQAMEKKRVYGPQQIKNPTSSDTNSMRALTRQTSLVELAAAINLLEECIALANSEDANNTHIKEIRKLLLNGTTPNVIDGGNNTPLHYLAQKRRAWSTMDLLLKHKARPNIQNALGVTPLHIAAQHNNDIAIELLLEHGAQVNIRDRKKNTAYFYAFESKHKEAMLAFFRKRILPKSADELRFLNICLKGDKETQDKYKKNREATAKEAESILINTCTMPTVLAHLVIYYYLPEQYESFDDLITTGSSHKPITSTDDMKRDDEGFAVPAASDVAAQGTNSEQSHSPLQLVENSNRATQKKSGLCGCFGGLD